MRPAWWTVAHTVLPEAAAKYKLGLCTAIACVTASRQRRQTASGINAAGYIPKAHRGWLL